LPLKRWLQLQFDFDYATTFCKESVQEVVAQWNRSCEYRFSRCIRFNSQVQQKTETRDNEVSHRACVLLAVSLLVTLHLIQTAELKIVIRQGRKQRALRIAMRSGNVTR